MNYPSADHAVPQLSGFYATAQAAREAIDMALPLIETAMQHKHVGESGFLYIVVMNPLAHPHQCRFEDAILCEHAVGDPARWDADYAGFARAKAGLHWRTGLNTEVVQTRYPHLLEPGDTTLHGTAAVDGIVVGVSGANPWYDEAFAGVVAHCFKAVMKGHAHRQSQQGGTNLPAAGTQGV